MRPWSRVFEGDQGLYVLCLLFSGFVWIFVQLSSNYTIKEQVRLVWIQVPDTLVESASTQRSLSYTAELPGFYLLSRYLLPQDSVFALDYHDWKDFSYILASQIESKIKKTGSWGKWSIDVDPDTLWLHFVPATIKKVPVKLILQIQSDQIHHQHGNIRLEPSEVLIKGPIEWLGGISHWLTDSLILTEPKDTARGSITLIKGPYQVSEPSVNYTIPIESFTEKKLSIPVRVLDFAGSFTPILLPQRIEVTFQTPFSRFHSIKESDFEAVADLKPGILSTDTLVPVQIIRHPDYIKSLKWHPPSVEFLMRQNPLK